MLSNPSILLWMALACASISWTLTKTPVFSWVGRRMPPEGLLEELWDCPYCMGHWVAMALVAVVRPEPFTGGPVDWVVAVFVITMLSGFLVAFYSLMAEVLRYLRTRVLLASRQLKPTAAPTAD